jgi:hypothetical protein
MSQLSPESPLRLGLLHIYKPLNMIDLDFSVKHDIIWHTTKRTEKTEKTET